MVLDAQDGALIIEDNGCYHGEFLSMLEGKSEPQGESFILCLRYASNYSGPRVPKMD